MNVLVVYDSYYASSRFVARVAAAAFQNFATVRLLPINQMHLKDFENVDFLVIGGSWSMTSSLEQLFKRSPGASLSGIPTAIFDTHYRHSASGISTRVFSQLLVSHGAILVQPPETFYSTDFDGPLERGEPDRIEVWARNLAAKFALA